MKKNNVLICFILFTQQTFSQSSILTDIEGKEKRSSGEIIFIMFVFIIATIVFISKNKDKK